MRAYKAFSLSTRSSLRPLSHPQNLSITPTWSTTKPLPTRIPISRYHQTPFLRSAAKPPQASSTNEQQLQDPTPKHEAAKADLEKRIAELMASQAALEAKHKEELAAQETKFSSTVIELVKAEKWMASQAALEAKHKEELAAQETKLSSTIIELVKAEISRMKAAGELIAAKKQKEPKVELTEEEKLVERRWKQPAYSITFICKPCQLASSHHITKQAYHFGTVVVTCPFCKNRHLMADNLKIFSDKSLTIEDIMRDKGQSFKKGFIDPDLDFEIWDDGVITQRKRRFTGVGQPAGTNGLRGPLPPPTLMKQAEESKKA